MKKQVANLIRINSEYTSQTAEGLLTFRYNLVLENGYSFPEHDFYSYCALLIKRNGIKNIPENFIKSISENGELNPEIRFELVRLNTLDEIDLSVSEKEFFNQTRRQKVEQRKAIIKFEISRTNPGGNLNSISHTNSLYYKELLNLTSDFSDITLVDWFIPIVLKYKTLIHIFVKHVEETKFGDGLFKQRTFFSYQPNEIWILLKTVIKKEVEDIKEHYIENSVNFHMNKPEVMKPYHRNAKNPILYNGDQFVLSIDKNGFITKFHQI